MASASEGDHPGRAGGRRGPSALGDEAPRWLAPDEEPLRWPEHFDIGRTVDEINYGVSRVTPVLPKGI